MATTLQRALKGNTHNFARHKYLIILLVSCSTMTTALAYNYALIDGGFVYSNLASSAVTDLNGNIYENPMPSATDSLNDVANGRVDRILVLLLPVFLHNIAGIPYADLIFFPLMGILLPISAYLFGRRLLKSEFYGFLFGIFVAFEAQALLRNYNLNIQGYGFLFYFLTMLVALNILTQRRINGGDTNNTPRSHYLLLILFVLANVFSYYTTEFYSVIFFGSLAAILYFARLIGRSGHFFYAHNFLITTFMIAAIIMVAYEDRFFETESSYLGRIQKGYISPVGSLQEFVNDSFSRFDSGPTTSADSSVVSTPRELAYLNLLLLLIIVASVPLVLIIRKRMPPWVFMVCCVIVITGVLDIALYLTTVGDVDLKYVYFIFPLFAIVFARYTNKRSVAKYFVVAFFLVLILRFGVYVGEWEESASSFSARDLSDYFFIMDHTQRSNYVLDNGQLVPVYSFLTDNRAAGKILFVSAVTGNAEQTLAYQYKSIDTIQFLYDGDPSSLDLMKGRFGDNVVVTRYSTQDGFAGQGWQHFPPLSNLTNAYNTEGTNVVFSGEEAILIKLPRN